MRTAKARRGWAFAVRSHYLYDGVAQEAIEDQLFAPCRALSPDCSLLTSAAES